ncbi:MAG: TonB-dependent receptor [Steroidobacteraceae bacterium]
MNPRSDTSRANDLLRLLIGLMLVVLMTISVHAAVRDRVDFDIAEQTADRSLIEFARQAGISVLLPTQRINQFSTRALVGRYAVDEALAILLRDSGLAADLSATGVLAIRLTNNAGETQVANSLLRGSTLGSLVVLCGGITLQPGVACAQEGAAQAQTSVELEEIIVTAEKRETNLQKTAISIQSYSGKELKQQSKTRIDDIMNGVVGVNLQDSPVAAFFYMRGVEAMPTGTGPLQSPSVAVLINGIYQNRGETVRGGTLDLARAEVMRGTQSTNLGASALSGAVSLVSNVPVFEYQANGTLEAGNYNLQSMEGILNVPLTDNQAIRVAYSSNKRDGFLSSGAGESDIKNSRLKYRWKPNDSFDAVFTISNQSIGGNSVSNNRLLAQGYWTPYSPTQLIMAPDNTNDTNPGVAGVQGDADTAPDVITMSQLYITPGTTTSTQCAPVTAAITSTIIGGAQATMGCPAMFVAINDGVYYKDRRNPWDDGYPAGVWPNNPLSNTDITSYSAEFTLNTSVGTLTLSPSAQHTNFKSVEVPGSTGWAFQKRNQNTQQFEARMASDTTSALTWLTGLYYYHANDDGIFQNVTYPGSGMAPAAGVVDPADCRASTVYCYGGMSSRAVHTSASAYGNFTYEIIESLRAIGGIRYSHDKREFRSSQNLNTAPAVVGSGNIPANINGPLTPYIFDCLACSGDRTWSKTTFRAGFEYDFRPESMLYVTYATGYQPGSIAAGTKIVTNGVVTQNGTNAQQLNQITVGVKNRFFGNRLQLNLEAFDSKFKDREVTLPASELNSGNAVQLCTTALPVNNGYRAVVTDTTGCLSFAGSATDDAFSRGVDLEMNFLPSRSDRVDLSVEYLDAGYSDVPRLTSTVTSAADVLAVAGITAPTPTQTTNAGIVADRFNANAVALKDMMTQNAPKWSATASYQHEFLLPGGSLLTPRLSGMYKSQYWTAFGTAGASNLFAINQALRSGAFRPDIQRGYSLFDAFLTWRTADDKFSATTYMKNIENEAVVTNLSGNFLTLGSPRTYGLIMSASF